MFKLRTSKWFNKPLRILLAISIVSISFVNAAKAQAALPVFTGIMTGYNSDSTLTSTGPVSQYYNGDYVHFRFAVANLQSPAQTGSIYVNSTGQRNLGCSFFDGTINNISLSNLLGTNPTYSVGSITQQNINTPNALWSQRLDFNFTTPNNSIAFVDFDLRLSNNANSCSNANTQQVFLSDGNNGYVIIKNHIAIASAWQPSTITATKHIDINGDGNSDRLATAGEWSFSLDGGNPIPTDNNGQVTFVGVGDGSHTITESGGPNDYYFSGGSGSNCIFDNQTATATATVINGPQPQNASCEFTNSLDTNPAISIVKSGPTQAHAGDIINFSYNVSNDGNVPLSGIDVTDNVTGATTCPQSVLQPLESMICTDSYQIPDNQTTNITNVATVVGYFPSGNLVESYFAQSQHTTQIINPSIHLIKTADKPFVLPGQTINYSFVVTNSGNVPLANVTIDDPLLQNIISGPSGDVNNNNLLDQGEVWGYSGEYTVLTPIAVTNTATVRAYDPLELVVSDTSSVTTEIASGMGGSIDPIISPSGTLPATGADGINFSFSIIGASLALVGKRNYDKYKSNRKAKK